MAWVKLDDGFPDHPKVAQAGPRAGWIYVCALAYCSRNRTNGFIPAGAIKGLTAFGNPKKHVDALVKVGLWDISPGGYSIRDYQPPITVHPMRAAWDAMRAAIAPLIFARDGYRCLLCGASRPLTVDHHVAIVNGGTNDLTNLRTLCRPCNSRKGAR